MDIKRILLFIGENKIAIGVFLLITAILYLGSKEYIPTAVFTGLIGAITGAGLTLYGTQLQNRAQDFRQKELLTEQANRQQENLKAESDRQVQRLNHESDERRKEREMNLRREIFLGGVEAIGKMSAGLLDYANANIPMARIDDSGSNAQQALSKITVIAKIETIEALDTILTHIRKSAFYLTEKRAELDHNLNLKKIAENDVEVTNQYNQQLINLLNAPNPNLETINQVNFQLNKNRIFVEEKQKFIFEIELQCVDQILLISELCMNAFCEAEKLGAKGIICLRRELDFPIDEEKYLSFVEDSTNKLESDGVEFVKDLVQKQKERFGIE